MENSVMMSLEAIVARDRLVGERRDRDLAELRIELLRIRSLAERMRWEVELGGEDAYRRVGKLAAEGLRPPPAAGGTPAGLRERGW